MSLSLLLLTCAPLVGPQDSQSTYQAEKPNQTQDVQKYVSLDEMMSKRIPLQPMGQPRDPAAGGERGQAGQQKKQGQQVQLEDFVLKGDGSLCWAAVSTSGLAGGDDRTVLVPVESIQHRMQEGKLECMLALSPEQLQSMQEFDLSTAKRDGKQLITMIRAADATFDSESRAMEASARKPEYKLASEVMGLEVRGSDGKFGKVSDAVVNVQNHKAEYLLVSHGQTLGMGGDKAIIPHRAFTMQTEDDECILTIANKTVEELEEHCVKYEKPEKGFIDALALKKADQMSGARMDGERADGKRAGGQRQGGEKRDR